MSRQHSDEARLHAELVLAASREELTRADGKASLLLASGGVVVGALVAALLAKDWSPFSLPDSVEWLWWLGVAAAAVGIAALGVAVYPRTTYHHREPEVVSYFGDVVATPVAELEQRLEDTVRSPRAATLDQLRAVAHIVDRKYRAIQAGMWSLAASAVLCTGAVLLSHA